MSFWNQLFGVKESPKSSMAERESTQPSAAATPQPPSIHEAAYAGDLEQVKALLTDHPDWVFSTVEVFGLTPLHMAAGQGHKDVAALLLINEAEVNAKDNGGWTALQSATFGGHTEVAALLLGKKADVDFEDNKGWTPLHHAAWYGHKDMVALLLDNKAKGNAKDKTGRTPLLYGALNGHKEVAELLPASKTKVNAKDNNGDTPLRLATLKGHTEMVELLRQHGGHEYTSNATASACYRNSIST